MSRHVTAGFAALTPDLRDAISKARQERERNRALLREDIQRERLTTSPDGDIPVTSLQAQMGRALMGYQIIQRLKRCNPNLVFEVSLHDKTKTGIYLKTPTGKQFLCGMQTQLSPEFSVRVPETKEIPHPDNTGEWVKVQGIKTETRGWRTVLAMLIRSKAITLEQAERHFEVNLGRSSKNWQTITH